MQTTLETQQVGSYIPLSDVDIATTQHMGFHIPQSDVDIATNTTGGVLRTTK